MFHFQLIYLFVAFKNKFILTHSIKGYEKIAIIFCLSFRIINKLVTFTISGDISEYVS